MLHEKYGNRQPPFPFFCARSFSCAALMESTCPWLGALPCCTAGGGSAPFFIAEDGGIFESPTGFAVAPGAGAGVIPAPF